MTRENVQRRPDKEEPASLAFDSQAIHAGNVVDATTGAILTPIVMSNSYRLPDDTSSLDWSDLQTLFYNRNSGHNQLGLERKLAALERAEGVAVFSTGVAALHAVFFTFLKTGDHVVVSDVTYEAVWRLFSEPNWRPASRCKADTGMPNQTRTTGISSHQVVYLGEHRSRFVAHMAADHSSCAADVGVLCSKTLAVLCPRVRRPIRVRRSLPVPKDKGPSRS